MKVPEDTKTALMVLEDLCNSYRAFLFSRSFQLLSATLAALRWLVMIHRQQECSAAQCNGHENSCSQREVVDASSGSMVLEIHVLFLCCHVWAENSIGDSQLHGFLGAAGVFGRAESKHL